MPAINTQGLINFSGLASGLDTASIVKALVAKQHAPIDALQGQQKTLTAHNAIYTQVIGKLQALGTALQGLDSSQDFAATTATTDSPTVVTAAAGTGAAIGSYKIEVSQLATAQRSLSNAFPQGGSAGQFGAGTLTLQVGSDTAVDVQVDSGMSLRDLATSINSAVSGVYATVVNDGGNERLSVTGSSTGAANAVTFTEQGTTLGLNDTANQSQSAQDAVVRVNGVTAVTSASNTVTNAISGVTLQLQSGSSTPATLTVAPDTSAMTQQVQKVVDAYNAVITTVNPAITYSGHYDPNALVGDAALQGLVRDMQRSFGDPVSGTGSTLQALVQVGVKTLNDGTLSFDGTAFAQAAASDPTGMARLFDRDDTLHTEGVAGRMEDTVQRYTSIAGGMLTTVSQSINQQIGQIADRIDSLESQLDTYESSLNAQFNQLETTMSQLKAQGSYLDQLSKNKS